MNYTLNYLKRLRNDFRTTLERVMLFILYTLRLLSWLNTV